MDTAVTDGKAGSVCLHTNALSSYVHLHFNARRVETAASILLPPYSCTPTAHFFLTLSSTTSPTRTDAAYLLSFSIMARETSDHPFSPYYLVKVYKDWSLLDFALL